MRTSSIPNFKFNCFFLKFYKNLLALTFRSTFCFLKKMAFAPDPAPAGFQ